VFCLYPEDALFVESSINLIASIFLSGSKRYIISAAAARCVSEAAIEILIRKSKIPDQGNTDKEHQSTCYRCVFQGNFCLLQ
jgi:hypothetical protein